MNFKEPKMCRRCGSKNFQKNGRTYYNFKTYWTQKYKCRDCGLKFDGQTKHLVDWLPSEEKPFEYKNKAIPPQDWIAYTQAQNAEKTMLMDLVKEITGLIEFKAAKRIGRKSLALNEVIFCLALKCYSGLSSRRLNSDLEIAKNMGFISHVPHFTSVMNYFDDERLTPVLHTLVRLTALPLKQAEDCFAVDASGFSTSKFARWFDHKFGKESERRVYLKGHIFVGTKSNIVVGAEITLGNAADSPQLIPLLNKARIDFEVKELSADKAYSSRKNLEAVSEAGAMPYIPFKSSTKPKRKIGNTWNRMYWFFKNRPQEFFEHYHKRSNVESTFGMIKQKFGAHLMTKNPTANVNEVLLKLFCHNLCVLIQEYHENKLDIDLSTQTQKIAITVK